MRIVKIFLWVSFIALLGWTGYAIYDMTNWKNSLDPSQIFCSKDEKVLVIHKPNSYDWNQIDFSTLAENKNIVNTLLPNLPANCKVYISKTRNLLLFENSNSWTDESIQNCLTKSKLRYSLSGTTLKIEQFLAIKAKNKLLIYKYEEDVEGLEFNWNELDQNATASIVSFGKNVIEYVDVYCKNDNTIEFHTKNINGIEGKVIDDISIFQSYIPATATNYVFYENTYLKSIDQDYRKGPIQGFVESGIVSFIFQNQKIALCQFKEGQNAVQNLNEFFQKPEDNTLSGKYSNLLISNKLNLPKGTYFVKTIDNIGIFSESEETIDQLLKEIEIGKTWLYNEEELNLFRQNLPKSVSFRSFSKLVNKSLSVLGNKLIETQVKYKSEKLKLNTDLEYISISINGKVRDFKSFPGKGNIVCLTEDGTIIGIENGIKAWKKGMEDKPIGSLQIVKSKEKEYLVATGSKSIHIIDRYGKYLDSYPLKWTKSEFVCASNAFINKGQILVGAITSTNHLVLFNSSGKLFKEIEIREMTGVSEIDFFSVDSKMHVSIKCSNKILIYNVDEKKIVKQIEITNSSMVSDVPSFSIISFTKSGKLIQLKYPNEIEEHTSDINSDIIIEAQSVDSNLYTISLSGNQAFVSKNGKELLFEKDFANSRIISGAIFKNTFKETYFAVVDGMENGVYLYDEKGRMYVKGKIEGSNKVTLNQSSGYSVVVTTIIDGYMIQYLVK